MKRSAPIIAIIALALIGIVMMTTGKDGGGTTSSAQAGSGDVPSVLDFTAPKLGGGEVNGADYAGKDVAFWFWAPW